MKDGFGYSGRLSAIGRGDDDPEGARSRGVQITGVISGGAGQGAYFTQVGWVVDPCLLSPSGGFPGSRVVPNPHSP